MSHIFISYSRKDLAIAEKIIDALVKDDLEPWIDWKSIPKGEKFEKEIYQGIEKAEIFLSLISPDSANSEWCNREIVHAVENGKRNLPIAIRDTDSQKITPEISKRNWIFCRDEKDDFDKAIEETRKTIHTDYEWLKYHTELQVKALKWEQRKDNSRLLRGKELREAEKQFFEINNEQDPQPTKLQREYLFTSRKEEDMQRRRFTLGLAIGSMLLLAIAIIDVWQRRIAQEQTRIAQEQTRIARTSELSATALNLRDQQFDLALLLAAEAYNTNKTLDQTKTALNLIGKDNPSLIRYFQEDQAIDSIAWSSDGRLASAAGDTVIWDIESGEPLKKLIYSSARSGHELIFAIAWSPNNAYLASAAADGNVIVWDVKIDSPTYGQPVHKLHGHNGVVLSVDWSQDGELASGGSDHTVIVWDLSRNQPKSILRAHSDQVNSVAWSANGQLASGGRDNTVIVWNLETKIPAQIMEGHRDWIISVAWSPNGQLASADLFELILWDITDEMPIRKLQLGAVGDADSGITGTIAWSPGGRLASGTMDGRIIIWDIDNGKPSQVLRGNDWITSIAWSKDDRLTSGSQSGAMILWEPFSWQPIQLLRSYSGWVESVTWSPDGRLASSSLDGTIMLWDLETGQPTKTLHGNTGLVRRVAWSPDGQLASGADDGEIILWDLENGKPGQILQAHGNKVTALSWLSDSKLASGSQNGAIIIWDLNKASTSFSYSQKILQGDEVSAMDWSQAGELASSYYKIFIWDPTSKVIKKELSSYDSGKVNSVVWVGSKQLASGSADGKVIIWDVEKGIDQTQLWLDQKPSVNSLSWSKKEKLLALGLTDNSVILWNTTTVKPAQIIQGHTDEVISVAWSGDGKLASASQDNTIIIWAFLAGRSISTDTINENNASYWASEACKRAGRNITQLEWDKYLSWKGTFDPNYHTCPQWQ